jgi:predicted TIM-barrel fold metal-dependent hydrolase
MGVDGHAPGGRTDIGHIGDLGIVGTTASLTASTPGARFITMLDAVGVGMTTVAPSPSAAVRQQLDHPVVDADGHDVEFVPALLELVREEGGPAAVERFGRIPGWYRHDPAERLRRRMVRPPWWALPTRHTVDHATSVLPRLLRERMADMGLDFTVLYPSVGLAATHIADPELRRAVCRAVNRYHAEVFGPHRDVTAPAAAIPMHTPAEAIDALDHAVGELGLRALMMAGHVRRPLPGTEASEPHGTWIDVLAVDSAHDYDPVWAHCQELGVAPAFHSGSMGWGSRTSVTNYMYNHIGHFAAASEALCKALFFGGVTRRFPAVRFAFLEAGVGWATMLLSDIVGHWEKRNGQAMANYDPANLDRELLADLLARYGDGRIASHAGELDRHVAQLWPDVQDRSRLDDFAEAAVASVDDIVQRFVPSFFFGCEADDPTNAWAFDTRVVPGGTPLNAVFSSDIGHWDVPDMRDVLHEAYEMVERGLFDRDDFRRFVFEHPVHLLTDMNPAFFTGTAIEAAVAPLVTHR